MYFHYFFFSFFFFYTCTFTGPIALRQKVRGLQSGKKRALPDDGEEDGPAAQQVDEDEDLLPRGVLRLTLLSLRDDDLGHVGQHL